MPALVTPRAALSIEPQRILASTLTLQRPADRPRESPRGGGRLHAHRFPRVGRRSSCSPGQPCGSKHGRALRRPHRPVQRAVCPRPANRVPGRPVTASVMPEPDGGHGCSHRGSSCAGTPRAAQSCQHPDLLENVARRAAFDIVVATNRFASQHAFLCSSWLCSAREHRVFGSPNY